MAQILGIQTVYGTQVISVDSNPSSGLGTIAPVGSIALATDSSGVYYKNGVADTAWIKSSYYNNYGSFYDTSKQNAALSTPTPMKFNTTDTTCTNGVSIVNDGFGNPTLITVSESGIYNIQFSAQLDREAGSGIAEVNIWFKKNGNIIPDSNTSLTISGAANKAKIVAAWNIFVQLNAGENAQIIWMTDDINIVLLYRPENLVVPYPAVPSVILTVNKIA